MYSSIPVSILVIGPEVLVTRDWKQAVINPLKKNPNLKVSLNPELHKLIFTDRPHQRTPDAYESAWYKDMHDNNYRVRCESLAKLAEASAFDMVVVFGCEEDEGLLCQVLGEVGTLAVFPIYSQDDHTLPIGYRRGPTPPPHRNPNYADWLAEEYATYHEDQLMSLPHITSVFWDGLFSQVFQSCHSELHR